VTTKRQFFHRFPPQGGGEMGGYASGFFIYLSADRLYLFNQENFKK
jgi:hypothetical protein